MAFSEFLKDKATGTLSAARLLLLLWGIGVLVIWAVVSWQMHQLQPVPDSVVTILGILVGGKTVQRFAEK